MSSGLQPGSPPRTIPSAADVPLRLVPAPPAAAPIPWPAVRELRSQVANTVADWSTLQDPAPDEQATRVFGRQVVTETVRAWANEQMRTGRSEPPSPALEKAMGEAVFNAAFGLGRLQPLVDNPDIENIEANGADQVWLSYADGRIERGPAIADSDADLIADLQYWASRSGRNLSKLSKPSLHLDLPDGMSRLAAMIETTRRPAVVVRRHRMVTVTLPDLVAGGTISQGIAAFLQAAVRTNANIVVTGAPNAGKTTLLRAIASAIPQMERYATLETEYELHLDKTGWHPRMLAFQAREGNTERDIDGRATGRVSLRDLVEDSLRMNFARLIVGEVRGEEILPMLEAVSTGGKGSLCTIHANSARSAFERIVSLCLSRVGMNEAFAYRLAGGAISYVVNVSLIDESLYGAGGRRRRFVDQIVEIADLSENGRPNFTDVFSPGPDGRAVPRTRPSRLPALVQAGFDARWFDGSRGDGQWAPVEGTAQAGPTR